MRIRQGIVPIILIVFGVVGVVSPRALSETITDIGSLEPLIAMDPSTVKVGNLEFYGFSYTGSQPPAPAPAASQIEAGAITSQPMGLSFSAAWESGMGYSQDSLISYYVHVTDDTTQGSGIMGLGLWFNGDSLLSHDGLTSASVTETVMTLDGTTIGQFSVFADGNSPFADRPRSTLNLSDCYRDLYIIEDISLHSSTTGLSVVSVVDSTYQQCMTPLPSSAWAGLVLLSGLAAPRILRRRTR